MARRAAVLLERVLMGKGTDEVERSLVRTE